MSVSEVTFNEDLLIVTVDSTAPPEAVIEPATVVVEIAGSGLQGAPGPAGDPGPPGPQGPPGSVSGSVSYTHDQATPSAIWTVQHDLGFFPNVTAVDSGGTAQYGEITYIDINSLTITFLTAFGGKAYCT